VVTISHAGASDSTVNAMLNALTFDNTVNEDPSTTARTVTLTSVTDTGSGTTPDGAVATINITAVNDNPSNAGSLPSDVSVIEDVRSSIDLSAIDLADIDAGSGSLTVTLTTGTGGGLIAATNTDVTIGGTGTALTLTGKLSDLNDYIDSPSNLTYLHSTADTNGDDADAIQVDVTDNGHSGSGAGGHITLGRVNVDIIAVYDIPPINDTVDIRNNEGDDTDEKEQPETATETETETENVEDPRVRVGSSGGGLGEGVPDPGLAAMLVEQVVVPPMDGDAIATSVADLQHVADRGDFKGFIHHTPAHPVSIDLSNLGMAPFETAGSALIEFESPMDDKSFVSGLEEMNRAFDDAVEDQEVWASLRTESAIGLSVSFSAGIISRMLRVGSLMTGFMSMLPLWKNLDPLPVLGNKKDERSKVCPKDQDTEDEEKVQKVENIFDKKDTSR